MTGSLVADEQLHADAIVAALNAALPAGIRAWEPDELKKQDPTPSEYVEVLVEPRFGGNLRGGATSAGGWRVQTRGVSETSIFNARAGLNAARAALQFASLEIGGKRTTPIQFETAEAVGEDEGWWSGHITWTYVL